MSDPQHPAPTTRFAGALANAAEDPQYLTRKEAADYLKTHWRQRVSAQTLATYACKGKGPPYQITDTGADALYTKRDLDVWARTRLSPGRVS